MTGWNGDDGTGKRGPRHAAMTLASLLLGTGNARGKPNRYAFQPHQAMGETPRGVKHSSTPWGRHRTPRGAKDPGAPGEKHRALTRTNRRTSTRTN
jgi:hypothetical protein